MSRRLWAMMQKEFRQFFRDKIMVMLILWLYTVEIILCTYALSFDVKDLSLAVLDYDRSPASRTLIEQVTNTGYFRLHALVLSETELQSLLDTGKVTVGLIIPPDFSRRLQEGRATEVQVILDGSNANTATIAQGYLTRIIDRYAQEQQRAWLGITAKTSTFLPGIDPQLRIWYNPDLRFPYFMVLSMIALAGMTNGFPCAALRDDGRCHSSRSQYSEGKRAGDH